MDYFVDQTLYWVFLPGFKNGALIPTTSLLDTFEKCFKISLIPTISPTHSSYPLSCSPIWSLKQFNRYNLQIPLSIRYLRYCFCWDFMTFACQLLYHLIVAVLVWYEEGPFNIATIGIFPLFVEHFSVMFIIVQVDRTIKSEQNHLRCLKKKCWMGIGFLFQWVFVTSSGSSPPGMRVPSLEQKQ